MSAVSTTQPTIKHNDTATIYCDTSVANYEQVSNCLKQAIQEAEKVLGCKTNCKFKVNLLVNKDGKYFGYGYIRVSKPEIYWMLLGRNPDGTERVEEYLDPNWVPPTNPNENLTQKEILEKNKNKSWAELAKEEEAFIHPTIKKILPPLVTIPGYEYDKDQIEHLKELEEDKSVEIPKIGYFEISRAFATDPQAGLLKNRICARKVPDWIPVEGFKAIFSTYVTEKDKKGTIYAGNKEITDTYPIINFVEAKKGGRIVFITFDPKSNDAIFALLMTKKTRIINPKNTNQKTTLIFMHAYDNQK